MRTLVWLLRYLAPLIVTAISVLSPYTALAVPTCKWSPPSSTFLAERDSLDPDRPFYVRLGPARFAIPWKYLHGRPRAEMPSCEFPNEGASVQFWLSDGSAPVEDTAGRPSFRPQADGKDLSDPANSVIRVVTSNYVIGDPPANLSPQKRYANVLQLYGGDPLDMYRDLKRVKYDLGLPDQVGFFFGSAEYDIYFSCIFGNACQAYLLLKREHLGFSLFVERGVVEYHKQLVDVLSRLLKEWKINSNSDAKDR